MNNNTGFAETAVAPDIRVRKHTHAHKHRHDGLEIKINDKYMLKFSQPWSIRSPCLSSAPGRQPKKSRALNHPCFLLNIVDCIAWVFSLA